MGIDIKKVVKNEHRAIVQSKPWLCCFIVVLDWWIKLPVWIRNELVSCIIVFWLWVECFSFRLEFYNFHLLRHG